LQITKQLRRLRWNAPMLSTVKHLLTPPTFDDDERTRRARLLNAILLSLIVMDIIFMATIVVALDDPIPRLVAASTWLMVMSAGLYFSRRGYVKTVSYVVTTYIWMFITVALFAFGGVQNPILTAYISLILLAGLLLGERAAGVFIGLSILGGLAAVIAQNNGIIEPAPELADPLYIWLNLILYIAVVAMLVRLDIRSVRAALIRARQNERSLAQTNRALDQTQQRWRSLVENAPDYIIEIDRDYNVRFVNRVNPGITVDDIIGNSVFVFVPPDDRDEVRSLMNHVFKTGEIRSYETIGVTSRGESGWFSTLASPIYNAGEVTGLTLAARDITEHKRSDESLKYYNEFQSLIMALSTRFINLSPDRTDEVIQETLQKIGEFAGADRCYIFTFSDDLTTYSLLHEWDAPDVQPRMGTSNNISSARFAWFTDRIKRQETVHIPSVEDLPPEAISVYQGLSQSQTKSIIAVPLVYQGKVLGFGGFHIVVSDRVWSDETMALLRIVCDNIINAMERQKAEGQRVELEVEKHRAEFLKRFIADISHDLKTPLAVITSNLYLIERLTDPEKQQDKLDTIKRQTARLDRLIQDILMISRLDNLPELMPERVNINELIQNILSEFHSPIETKHLDMALDLDSSLPLTFVDVDSVNRALVNLVENAINYTMVGGAITIRSRQETNRILVEVTDTGMGIADDDLPHIFDRFYRTDKARSTLSSGSGLGLAIVSKVMEMHNGRIEVESALGEGSTFRVALPISSDDMPQAISSY
jgi:PAS domain S-box-containing protein